MAETTEKSPADVTREEAQSIGDELREKGNEAMDTARDTARGYAERARDEAYARGEEYRNYAADETNKVASALRRASQDLNSGSPQERFVGQIADGVADAADRMRGMSLEDVARDTTSFARRNPAAFLGGAALVGFAAARFLKASARHEETMYLPPAPAPQPGAPVAAGVNAGTAGVPTSSTPASPYVDPSRH